MPTIELTRSFCSSRAVSDVSAPGNADAAQAKPESRPNDPPLVSVRVDARRAVGVDVLRVQQWAETHGRFAVRGVQS
jgi:hypothetical protein